MPILILFIACFFASEAHATGGIGLVVGLGLYLSLAVGFCSLLGILLNFALRRKGYVRVLNISLAVAIAYAMVLSVGVSLLSRWWHQNISLDDRIPTVLALLSVLGVWLGVSLFLARKQKPK